MVIQSLVDRWEGGDRMLRVRKTDRKIAPVLNLAKGH